MRQLLTRLAILALALTAASCSKDIISPEDLFGDASKEAKTVIHMKGDEVEDTVVLFQDKAVYRKSDQAGKSWLCAFSGGRMVYDTFVLSIYFDSIDKMRIGATLKPSDVMFSFIASSDSNATTHSYEGKITLADKGDNYVIFHFHDVIFKCSFGEYLIDGYLYCPLYDEFMYYHTFI